jgi:hypothetical protein
MVNLIQAYRAGTITHDEYLEFRGLGYEDSDSVQLDSVRSAEVVTISYMNLASGHSWTVRAGETQLGYIGPTRDLDNYGDMIIAGDVIFVYNDGHIENEGTITVTGNMELRELPSNIDNSDVELVDPTGLLATAAKQDAIIAAIITTRTPKGNAPKNVTTAGVRVALASAQVYKELIITAKSTNTGNIYVGDSTVSSSAGIIAILPSGGYISLNFVDAATIYLDADVSLEGVSFGGLI